MPKKIPTPEPQRKFLRKRSLAERYDCDARTIDRMRVDGRLPQPHFLPNSDIPLWPEDELIANERKATVTPRAK